MKIMLPITVLLIVTVIITHPVVAQQQRSPEHKIICPEVPRISGYEAYQMFKKGKTFIVDAHERSTYAEQHILGAINIPQVEADKMKITIPKDFKVIIYCR